MWDKISNKFLIGVIFKNSIFLTLYKFQDFFAIFNFIRLTTLIYT